MGPGEQLVLDNTIEGDWVVLVPAGTWHNITNVGDEPLKIHSIYAPPEHSHGTVHSTTA